MIIIYIVIGIAVGISLTLIFEHFFTEGVIEVDMENRKWTIVLTIPEGNICKYSTIKLKVVDKCKDAK